MPRPTMSRLAPSVVPLALLLLAFGRLVASPASILADPDRSTVDRARLVASVPGNDLTRQFWPLQEYVASTWARFGHLPEWDDRGFSGRPLVGNPQAGLFYPPTWLAWAISAPSTLGWLTVGHLAWAVIGVGRLGRTLGLGGPGRMTAAGCFALAPYVLAQVFEGHYPHVWAVAWYPWAFAAMIRVRRADARAELDLAACLAAVGLAGHPQEGYYLAVTLAIWAAADLVGGMMGGVPRGRLAVRVGVWAGAVALALGLLAVEWLPDILAHPWGLRAERVPARLASRYHPAALNTFQLLNPFALGGPFDYSGPANAWETLVGFGLVPLVLGGVGATWTRDRRRVAGWVALVLGAVLFALGRKFGVFTFLHGLVPGMDRFRVPARSLFLASLGMAVLAGHGVEALRAEGVGGWRDRWSRLGGRWWVAAAVLGAAVGWGTWQGSRVEPGSVAAGPDRRADRDLTGWRGPALALGRVGAEPTFWLALVGLTAGLGLGHARPGRRRAVAAGLGLLALVELAAEGHQLLVVAPSARFFEPGPTARVLAGEFPSRPGQPPLRLRADAAVLGDLAAVRAGWSKTDINDASQVQHAADLYERLYILSRPRPAVAPLDAAAAERARQTQQAILDRMAVDAAVCGPAEPRLLALLAAEGWPVVATIPGSGATTGPTIVARNPTALPRAYVVPRAEVVAADDPSVVDRLAAVDPREAVIMTADPLTSRAVGPARQVFRPAGWLSADPDRPVIRVTTDAPGLLVVADTWMPGWAARVDGRPAPVHRGNHAQRVIALPSPGRHEVELTYEAPGFRPGLAISGASAACWVVLGLVARLQARAVRA